MQFHILEPGDATRYAVAYDLVTIPGRTIKRLFFSFAVGEEPGTCRTINASGWAPMSIEYFRERVMPHEKNLHTVFVGFYVLHHLLGTQPYDCDRYDRIEHEFAEGWLAGLPTVNDLLRASEVCDG